MKEDIHVRTMSPTDIALGMRLKEGAGWNQVASDWEAYLALEPEGCFVAELGGRAVATTTTLHYERRFGWIGMVLVDPAARRRGIATGLINHAIAYLESIACPCQKLDATEAGARVYENMGFSVEYEVQRWEGWGKGGAKPGALFGALRPLSPRVLAPLARWDATAFGASRRPLLEWYSSNDSPKFLAGDPQQPAGYVVGRRGSGAWQMGPLVAEQSDVAQQLMTAFLLSRPQEPVIADVIAGHREAVRLLEHFGFTRRRVLQRMYRGENAWPGRRPSMFFLAGFEFG